MGTSEVTRTDPSPLPSSPAPSGSGGSGNVLRFSVASGFAALMICYVLRVDGNVAILVFIAVAMIVFGLSVAMILASANRETTRTGNERGSDHADRELILALSQSSSHAAQSGNPLVLRITLKDWSCTVEKSQHSD